MSKETPQITTILTTYRRPMYLRRAIMSVLKQTYRNVRVLVLDDASNDETEQVVHALATEDSRVQYVRHERNIGMTPSWRPGRVKALPAWSSTAPAKRTGRRSSRWPDCALPEWPPPGESLSIQRWGRRELATAHGLRIAWWINHPGRR